MHKVNINVHKLAWHFYIIKVASLGWWVRKLGLEWNWNWCPTKYQTSIYLTESSTGLVIVGPSKVKDCKSILFTEGIPEFKIKNTCLMKLKHFILSHFAWLLKKIPLQFFF